MRNKIAENYVLDTRDFDQFQQSGPREVYVEKPEAILTITVTRNSSSSHCTMGTFTAKAASAEKIKGDTTLDEVISGSTLELKAGTYDLGSGYGKKTYPIPVGTYSAVKRNRDFSNSFALSLTTNPAGFTDILLHVGNYPWNTEGCILLGTSDLRSVKVTPGTGTLKGDRKKWNTFVSIGMITEDKDTNGKTIKYQGKTDMITNSKNTLEKLKIFYNKLKAKYDLSISIIVE